MFFGRRTRNVTPFSGPVKTVVGGGGGNRTDGRKETRRVRTAATSVRELPGRPRVGAMPGSIFLGEALGPDVIDIPLV